MSSTTQEQRGWVLLLISSERHFFIGKASACGLHFVPAIAESDYETRNDGRVPNCWMCDEALERFELATHK
jgi:hypothetical protein